MKAINIEYVRSNEINDIFSYINTETGEKEYEYYPRTMQMTADEVEIILN